ncbi:MAG: hypothetical protein AAFP19_02155 [Bacteroidota bacterium]
MKKINLLIVLILIVGACNTDDDNNPPNTSLPYLFQDGFESVNDDLDDLFPSDGSRWTGIQLVNPNNGDNAIELEKTTATEGSYSLKFLSKPGDEILSKVDIEKTGFSAPIGSSVKIEADFLINNTNENLKELFLLDLECCSCWDPSVANNQCPGVRLKISGDNNYLSIERGKILGSTISQVTQSFPLQEWVNVRWEMTLAPNESGENRLFINQEEVIRESGKNMPNADEFRDEFAASGVDFNLRAPITYERLQIGATANPTQYEVEILVDNFKMSVE